MKVDLPIVLTPLEPEPEDETDIVWLAPLLRREYTQSTHLRVRGKRIDG